MDEDATWYGIGPRRRPHCIRRVALRERGTAPPPRLGPCLLWPRSPISATAELLLYNETFEPWLMARWKARVEFLLSVIELLFLSLAVEALQGKMCQNLLPSGVGRSLGANISGEGVVPGEYFLVSTKRDTSCYPTVQIAPCYVPSF